MDCTSKTQPAGIPRWLDKRPKDEVFVVHEADYRRALQESVKLVIRYFYLQYQVLIVYLEAKFSFLSSSIRQAETPSPVSPVRFEVFLGAGPANDIWRAYSKLPYRTALYWIILCTMQTYGMNPFRNEWEAMTHPRKLERCPLSAAQV